MRQVPRCPLPWSASTYGYTVRVLEHYVRERKLLTLEDAVRKMTSLPATALGLTDRGTIAPGKQADLVIFDAETVHDRSTPVAMARHPTGIEKVVVNGSVAVDHTGVTAHREGILVS